MKKALCCVALSIYGDKEVEELLNTIQECVSKIEDCAFRLKMLGLELHPAEKEETASGN
jgi:hypothetical protein